MDTRSKEDNKGQIQSTNETHYLEMMNPENKKGNYYPVIVVAQTTYVICNLARNNKAIQAISISNRNAMGKKIRPAKSNYNLWKYYYR